MQSKLIRNCSKIEKEIRTSNNYLAYNSHSLRNESSNIKSVVFNGMKNNLESLKSILGILPSTEFSETHGLILETKTDLNLFRIQIKFHVQIENEFNIHSISVKPSSNIYNQPQRSYFDDEECEESYMRDIIDEYRGSVQSSLTLPVMKILIRLNKLSKRYRDLDTLHEQFGNACMIYERNLDEIIFVFSFECLKNEIKHKVNIRLTLILSWNYPLNKYLFVDNESVIGDGRSDMIVIDQKNILFSEVDENCNMNEIRNAWNVTLNAILDAIDGRYQNNIIQYVNHIYQRLNMFSESSN